MPRSPHKRIMGNQKKFGPGTAAYITEIQGVNVLSEHFLAVAKMAPGFFVQLLDITADVGIEHARELVPVLSGDTYRSINKSPGVIEKGHKGEWSIRYGPTTFYAPFVEYGLGGQSAQPFMIPSGDLAEIVFLKSTLAFLNLLDTNTGGSGFNGHPRLKPTVSSFRSLLYSSSKFLGDIAVFGGREFLGPARAMMLNLARSTGDISSVMRGTLDTRITTRLRGRAIGKLSGVGVASLSSGKTYSAFPGGDVGRRVYQRTVGRGGSVGLSAFSFLGA